MMRRPLSQAPSLFPTLADKFRLAGVCPIVIAPTPILTTAETN